MTEQKDNYRLKVGIQVDRETHDKSLVLRNKHNINISALCRNSILSEYDRLEGKNNGGVV